MMGMSSWDAVLLAVAGLIAVSALARLMTRQRRVVLAKLQAEVAEEQQRQDAEKKAKAKAEKGKPEKKSNVLKAKT